MVASSGMGHTTIRNVIYETCTVLWDKLQRQHLPYPTEELFKRTADEFYEKFNFPNCAGCIDGKYIRIKCPSGSGHKFYNFLLQVVADVNYKFTCVDIGGYSELDDVGTFTFSTLYNDLEKGLLKLPECAQIPNSTVKLPYVLLGDVGYPLKPYLMKPYVQRDLSNEQKVFNSRLTEARKSVRTALGLMASKWKLFTSCMQSHPDRANLIIKCICLLHNIVIDREGVSQTDLAALETSKYQSSMNVRSRSNNRYTHHSGDIREAFKTFINCNERFITGQYLQDVGV